MDKFSFRAFNARMRWEACLRNEEASPIIRQVLTNGWPNSKDYGQEAVRAFWLITQHQDHDLELQKLALKELSIAIESGYGSKRNFAYLTDRVSINSGVKQIYGTQINHTEDGCVPRPLSDPKNVNSRRSNFGMESLDTYISGVPGC